uniref:Phosphomannomutase n=1 Tax=Ditylenchus dipsaci TaxID=166011 RepID=A0A915E103_9BILA
MYIFKSNHLYNPFWLPNLKYLTPHFDTIHFFGDKTFKGGNDYEIFEHPSTIGHTVQNPDHTRSLIEND